MQVTVEEFQKLIELASYYSTLPQDKYSHDFTKFLVDEAKKDAEFRHFVKSHYPEAIVEWHALQKIGE